MKITFENQEVNLPDFLIVGAAKSGTTSMYYHLEGSKNVLFPKEKESHFFTFYNNPPNFQSPSYLPTIVSDLKQYAGELNKVKSNQKIGDASTSYLYKHEVAIKNIKNIYGEKAKDIKIIIILRNPVERAWSQYWHNRKNFNEDLDFLEAIDKETVKKRLENNWSFYYNYLDFGFYTKQIESFQKFFPNVKVYLQEDLKNSPKELMNDLSSFIGIPNFKIDTNRIYNPSGVPKNNLFGKLWEINVNVKSLKKVKKILPKRIRKYFSNKIMERALVKQELGLDARKKLIEIYSDEIDSLYDLLQREEIKNWKNA
ncbi:MAG: sulfotransferase domain-containing protein [Eudoraea sp.]|nr:sulfotransferase domain-containing protein [Eudoraea sp.]